MMWKLQSFLVVVLISSLVIRNSKNKVCRGRNFYGAENWSFSGKETPTDVFVIISHLAAASLTFVFKFICFSQIEICISSIVWSVSRFL
jgi:hypothetical protein